jgi:hypothetical protein
MNNEELEVEVIKEEISHKDNDITKTVIEFFLGKNVIAKIAAVLIFLGIVSFGQLAYQWIDDIGRVIVVAVIGMLFTYIGRLFEGKKNEVFSNIFYSLSVFVLYLSIILAKYEYELIFDSAFIYLSVGLMIACFVYFGNKRYDFLDAILFVFYIIVGLAPKQLVHI